MQNIITLLITLFTISFSYSQDWETFFTDDDGNEFSYKLHSKSVTAKMPKVWIATNSNIFEKASIDLKKYGLKESLENLSSVKILTEFNCYDVSFRIVAFVLYNDKNEEVHYQQYDFIESPFEYSRPDTYYDVLIRKVCQ